jgi:amidase
MFSIEEASILEIQKEMENGNLSSVDLVKFYIERITKYDKEGPKLNSVLEINPDLFFIAQSLDNERVRKGSRGLMHGIPVIIKDNINTGDKMHTSGGSLVLAESFAPEDAFVVKKLREAGAIIMGKSNMTEFANFMAENMPSGYSSRGGQVANPYDITKNPSGSSSGSAVAVAANLCTVAVGTETIGSILSPSQVNCIVGIKPTVGLVSRNGIIPISHSQDTAGPMARNVSDAAILLSAMIGVDEKDPATWVSEGIESKEYSNAILNTDIEGLRIGVSTVYYDLFTSDERQVLDNAINILQQKGAIIVKQDELTKGMPEEGSSVLLHEFKAGINYYLSKLGHHKIKTLSDIIEFNKLHDEKALKYGQKTFEMSEETSGTLTETKYLLDRMRDIEHSRTKGIDKIMREYKLDALLFLEDTCLAAISGYPSIIVPAEIINGTPYGIQFITKPFNESLIIKLGFIYEQATKHRALPPL